MLAAAICTAVALAALAVAEGLISAYCTCLQAAGADAGCVRGSCDSLRAAIAGLIAVLTIQSLAAFAAAGFAFIPPFGVPPMTYIMVALIMQFLLILTAIALLSRLRQCAATVPPVPPEPTVR